MNQIFQKNPSNDFGLYAKDKGISSLDLHYRNNKLVKSMTPYILEEREMHVTQMDVFSRLMAERIIWVNGEIDDNISVITQAQLMYLDSIDTLDVTLYIDTPGGSVKSGLSMVDVMDYIKSDVCTVNTGMAASMGSVLLGAGTKGKRSSLRFSTVMLHQSSGGTSGNIQDAEITMKEWQKTNGILMNLLAGYCDKTVEQIKNDSSRDFWMDSETAKAYGIIDNIILKKQ